MYYLQTIFLENILAFFFFFKFSQMQISGQVIAKK